MNKRTINPGIGYSVDGKVVQNSLLHDLHAREQVQVLYMQAPISNIVLLIIIVVFSAILQSRVESGLISVWFWALFITSSIRLILWFFRHKRPAAFSDRLWLKFYFQASILVGFSWSIIYPLLYFSNDIVVTISLAMLSFGIAGASVVALSVYLPAFLLYTYPQIISVIFTLLMFDDRIYYQLSIGIFFYLMMITLFTYNLNRNWLRAIELQARNDALIEELNDVISQREVVINERTREVSDKNESLSLEINERKKIESALRESEERFQLAMRGANDGLYDWDLINNTIYFSPRWKNMLGYKENELPNDFSVWENLVDAGDRERSWDMLTDYINGNRDNFKMEFAMQHKDGHWVDILSRAFLLRNESGTAIRVVGTHVDISELKNKEEMIKVLSQALEQSPVLVIITNPDADIEYVNRTFETVSGYSKQEVIGKNPRIFQSGLTPLKSYQEMWTALTNCKTWSGEMQNRKKNGEIYWEMAHIAPVLNKTGQITHYVAVKEDITDKKYQQEKIQYQAHYDSLTKLPNRFLALDRLKQSLSRASRDNTLVAVLFLDLDGFKRINDSLGHEVGDRLLVMAAERLSASIRDEDTLCRLGGDEFISILQGLKNPSEAQLVARNQLACFSAAFNLDKRELRVTASIGIAVSPNDGESPAELLRNADTAMYYSKNQGRNNFHYYKNSMNLDVTRNLSIEQQLHGALARNEFTVLYQPLIDLQTRSIIGVEALLRWHSQLLGEVVPEDFIPVAEQTGSIDEIGMYVLSQAIGRVSRWRKMNHSDMIVAVNLSPAQFRNPQLGNDIMELLNKSSLPASALELEITEGVLLSGYPFIDDTINLFKKHGIGISMDDFGTGYSSLSYLRSYPFDTLKIDRSFINDIWIDGADREVINAAISMGHGLGLKVIAEGVETNNQLNLLIQQGCDIAQGYLFSKPVAADKITELLTAGINK